MAQAPRLRAPRAAGWPPAPLFVCFLAGYLGVIAWGWFQQGETGGELLGHAAKIQAALGLLASGDFGWFPGYLTGSPAATLLSFGLSIPIYAPGLLFAGSAMIGMKITALVLLGLAGWAAFAFGSRLARDGWAGFAVGVAYVLSPQLLLRTGWQEHMTIVACFPLVPLAFLAMLRVAERGSTFDALLLAASVSATLLAWSKMGATMALPLAAFAAWLFVSRPEARTHLLRGAVWAIPATLLLGVLPLLPLLRERAFMTVFEMDPFAVSQRAYSIKTATAWFDRGGELFANLPILLRVDRGGYYLGLIGMAAVAAVIVRTWTARRDEPGVSAIRAFLLLALGAFWISFGPRSVLGGHFEFLAAAENFPDPGIPLHWLTLAAPGVVLYWVLPPRRWRAAAFTVLFAIYLLVPAFRILESLPLYADLRAPDSFWILNGTFAWAVAAGLAVVFIARTVIPVRWRALAAVGALGVAALDHAPYFRDFFTGALPEQTLADYRAAGGRLAAGEGRVFVGSGRYFYLDLPLSTGRPLASEALNRYLTPKWSVRLQTAGLVSATATLTYLNLSGVADVLLERRDPDIPEKYRSVFRMMLPITLENDGFTLLTNRSALYPGFFATTAVPAPAGLEESRDALIFAAAGVVTVARPDAETPTDLPGLVSPAEVEALRPPPLARISAAGPRTPARVTLDAPGRPGWVMLSESWHPDWRATVDGQPTPVFRAAGAFPGVPVRAGQEQVEFRFTPPAWYSFALGTSGLSWLAALGLFAAAPWWRQFRESATRPEPTASFAGEVAPVRRPLAIVPTFNEAESLTRILDAILAARADVHVLVVDDGSPDGTADHARRHAEFGARVHLRERARKLGLGSAYRDGFRWAIDRGYDACLEIDADFSHDPADIPRLLAALDAGADAAIGSRYRDGVRVINWPEHRLLLSAAASRYVRWVTGLPLTDATSGFKALRTNALVAIDWTQLRADGYGFQIELHWLLWTRGCRLVEVPIVFTERRLGQTKMTTGIAIEAAWRVLQLGMRNLARRGGPVT